MLFFSLVRQCLQTTNNRSVLLSRRLPATSVMCSKNKKNGVPDRWLDYRPVGERIPGTRFIAFKVPLRSGLSRLVPRGQAFGPWELLDALQENGQELGLIIDLTFTTRYYKAHDLPQSLMFIKIFTEGHQVPSDKTILSFKRAVRHFLRENPHNDKLIGVHCTHGLNRTGYLVCRYLIDVDGLDPGEAVRLFNASRGHAIERQNYLDDLQQGPRRSNHGMEQSEQDPARGLAVSRPPPPAPCLPFEEQWSHQEDEEEDVSQRAPPNQGWGNGGRGANHRSHHHHPRGRGGPSSWSSPHRRDAHHQASWTNQSPHRHHRRGGYDQSPLRGGGGTNWPLPHPGFPPGDGLFPVPPPPPSQWIHPSRAMAAPPPPPSAYSETGPPSFGMKRHRDRTPPHSQSQSHWGSPHHGNHHHHQGGKKSRDHHQRRHRGPPSDLRGPPPSSSSHPPRLPRYVPRHPPDHE